MNGPAKASTNFNPRTPVGCDLHIPGHGTFSYPISIHAPQWGATNNATNAILNHIFQSTHPSGVRPPRRRRARIIHAISIHAPQWGATSRNYNYLTDIEISIHAPQWGATIRFQRSCPQIVISIHAPQWGATQRHRRRVPVGQISIHAPQWGATCGVTEIQ